MTNPRETNTTTHFMREQRALQLIRDVVSVANAAAKRRTVVWSVGCSTGDEPYGLAMMCRATTRELDILATDINPDALERAQRGNYHERNLRHVDSDTRDRWFKRSDGEYWQISQELREQVRFRKHDVTREAAPRHDVDVALCRNVMVYFNAEQIQRAVATMCASLRPGGLLILGASEWLRSDLRLRGQMRLVPIEKSGVIVYQRVDGPVPVAPPPPPSRSAPPPLPPPPPRPSDVVDELRADGDTKLDQGFPVEAAACYGKAIALAPLLADLHLRIALCYLHAREPRLAYDSLRRALFLTPQLWEAWLLLADLAHDVAQARRYLHQARDLLESACEADGKDLRVFSGDPAAVLEAVRHRLRALG
jgi:chemotaxis methyl-accepting protein methylase